MRAVLDKVRATIREAAPGAVEGIGYGIPVFRLQGPLVYFAAFKRHIGLYPPVKGDAALAKRIARYAGEKGNLRLPLDEPMPYALIARITRLRVRQNLAQAGARAAGAKRARVGRAATPARAKAAP
ncbi:MAG: DUF1801 domain-containing protein [Burkholderiaceae bacterium]|nr:DUF1801 domain-containing protein [Burkholderiaceae bacterium]